MPVLPFFRASPAWAAQVFSLFWPLALRSKRKQLSFLQCCAASVAQRFSRLAPVAKFKLSVLASGSNISVKPTRILRSAYLAR